MTPAARGAKRVPGPAGPGGLAQAWVELRAEDPEAVSALGVARARLPEGRRLAALRRARLFELRGPLPETPGIESLLHRSTWFYNPHKERCTVRRGAGDPAPAAPGEQVVLVVEHEGERRAAAERWWLHETGQAIEVREAVVWMLRFEAGEDAAARASELARLDGRGRGLLCNRNAQDCSVVGADAVPLPWIGAGGPARAEGRR
ncbi:MAG TPA: hypothetical protein VI792_02790 [Candidatus Eisenbacteria bacterium]